jgi:RNA polymerase sigma-70 factor, ECF subfamily
MKGWLARRRRWFAPAAAVPASAFQDEDDPFPRHWREFPSPWPVDVTDDPAVTAALGDALRELPDSWRAVVLDRDVRHLGPEQVAAQHGITPAQQRAILNQARAVLRARLAPVAERGDVR